MAEFRAAAVFSNHMVLQRDKNVKIFGEGPEGETVTVSFCGQRVSARIKQEHWCAELAPMAACDGQEMTICMAEQEIRFCNIAVGEVWLAGGQSNMEFELQNCIGGKEVLEKDKDPKVRFYYTQKNAHMDEKFFAAERNTGWSEFDSESAKCWSAVGYFYARRLAEELGVTVGIIGCNWGGTSASAWMDRETLLRDELLRSYVNEYEAAIAGKSEAEQIREYREYEAYDADWNKRAAACYEKNPGMSWNEVIEHCGENKWPGPMCCINPFRPSGLYECMLRRVMPYTLRGFIYYQGESDDHKPKLYARLFSEMIRRWRMDWEDFSLPFLFVQLPMHRYEADPDYKHWCLIREAQMQVYETVKNTGIAVILDCGEFNEIHPKDKLPVGERLALQAMHEVYHIRSRQQAFGPLYRSAAVRGNQLELQFDCAEDGFEIRGDGSGFEIAGFKGEYFPAVVTLNPEKKSCLYVSAEQVEIPVKARYCWTNYGTVNYFGTNGLPAAPFRTCWWEDNTKVQQVQENKSEIRQVMEL